MGLGCRTRPSQFRPARSTTVLCFCLDREHTQIDHPHQAWTQRKGICNFLRGEPATCTVFFDGDAEFDVRTCRGITKEDKGRPVKFNKGFNVGKFAAVDIENDSSERRSGKPNELSDCRYCRVKDKIVGLYPAVKKYFFLSSVYLRPYSEFLQVGKRREGEWKSETYIGG